MKGASIVAELQPWTEKRWARFAPWAIGGAIGLLALQALAASRLELTFDEAYYFLWSRSLAFGYLDHPPMVALLIRASTDLFGNSELGVRALSLILVGVAAGNHRADRLAPFPLERNGRARGSDVDRHAARPRRGRVRDARCAARPVLDAGPRGARRTPANRQGAVAPRARRRARPGARIEVHRRLFRRRRRACVHHHALAEALAYFAGFRRGAGYCAHALCAFRRLERRARLVDLPEAARPGAAARVCAFLPRRVRSPRRSGS